MSATGISGHPAHPLHVRFRGDLNRSTQHFILKGKDGVSGDKPKISSRFYRGREDGAVGSLAAGRALKAGHSGHQYLWPDVGF